VTAVEKNSWADEKKIRAGDQILSVNGKPIAKMQPVVLKQEIAKRPMKIMVQRSKENAEALDDAEVKETAVFGEDGQVRRRAKSKL